MSGQSEIRGIIDNLIAQIIYDALYNSSKDIDDIKKMAMASLCLNQELLENIKEFSTSGKRVHHKSNSPNVHVDGRIRKCTIQPSNFISFKLHSRYRKRCHFRQ